MDSMPYAVIDGITLTKTEFFELLVDLANKARQIEKRGTWGDHTDTGLVFAFATDHNLL